MSQNSNEDRNSRASTTRDGYGAYAQLTSKSVGGKHNIFADDRPVIPIVFLPGIMGSNLFNTNTGEVVWIPDAKIAAGRDYAFASGKERQERLDSANTAVYKDGTIRATLTAAEGNCHAGTDSSGGSKDALRQRGWGGIYSSTYHPFMNFLQNTLNTVFHMGKLMPSWENFKNLPLQRYAMSPGMLPLTDDELKNLAKFRFEVWACGYNWLRSNAESANEVKKFIQEEVLPAYKSPVRLATEGKVILVTHSMGGLVARKLYVDAPKLVLGVVHGAQPCNGAAETYTNMRQGVQEFPLNVVLGDNAEKVDAVMTQCQGGLELLPFGVNIPYNPSPDTTRLDPPAALAQTPVPGVWLFYILGGRLQNCSSGEDVYEEIYKSDEWYGLLPKHNESYFDPAGIQRKDNPIASSRDIFTGFINKVEEFHKSIVGRYHPATYSFWASARNTPAVGEVLWEWSQSATNCHTGKVMREQDTGRGAYRDGGGNSYKLRTVWNPGDGTVPRASWEKDLFKMRGYCCLGNNQKDPAGFDHQNAFNDPRARDASVYFLAKLVSRQMSELHP